MSWQGIPELFHSAAAAGPLTRHNARWEALLRNWHERGGVAWTPGMIVSPDLRGRFETFLPWREFSRSMRGVARAFLPEECWIPQLLQEPSMPSLLEFWEELPEFCGRVVLSPEELLPFFCACADPPRFGTDFNRYPEQLEQLAKFSLPRDGRLLDLGCGVGLGTLEALVRLGLTAAVGVTQEPLEAWMAQNRVLPHDPVRMRHFVGYGNVPAQFHAGNLLEMRGEGGFAVILCNGLAGGRFLHGEQILLRLLKVLQAQLAPDGVVALANHFHEGRRPQVEKLLALARQTGWRVAGTWQNAFLTEKF